MKAAPLSAPLCDPTLLPSPAFGAIPAAVAAARHKHAPHHAKHHPRAWHCRPPAARGRQMSFRCHHHHHHRDREHAGYSIALATPISTNLPCPALPCPRYHTHPRLCKTVSCPRATAAAPAPLLRCIPLPVPYQSILIAASLPTEQLGSWLTADVVPSRRHRVPSARCGRQLLHLSL